MALAPRRSLQHRRLAALRTCERDCIAISKSVRQENFGYAHGMKNAQLAATAEPTTTRAWLYLVRASWERQARAHLMVWIGVGLMLFLTVAVALFTNMGFWDVRSWRQPRRGGATYQE